MDKYRVIKRVVTYYTIEVEAENESMADHIADLADENDFFKEPDFNGWETVIIEKVED